MEIRHHFSASSSRKEVTGSRGFLLRNQSGDILSFYNERQTRYEGWFIQKENSFYKLLDRINIFSAPVSGITNTGNTIYWNLEDGNQLSWKLLQNQSGLTISLSKPAKLEVILDIRPLYQFPGLGRSYEVVSDGNGHLIRYTDPSLDQPIYLHLRSLDAVTLKNDWRAYSYPRDAERNSEPSSLYGYTVAELETDLLALGAGWSKDEAERASLAASRIRPASSNENSYQIHDTLMNQVTNAKASVQQAMRWLQTEDGLLAGLPWFHQVWTRDELIATLGLSADTQREVIERYLGHTLHEGELPTFLGSTSHCADGVGWLCLLVREYGEHQLNKDSQQRLLHFLKQARESLLKHRQAGHGLIYSGHNATWMDTIGRTGYRLEIQTMYALLLELLFSLTDDPTYEQERLRMLGRIKQLFWHNNYLIDGLGDTTLRPNLFLAYLFQPDLLTAQSWQTCFDTALHSLRTPWGGLSSIAEDNPAFHPISTGENNKSYHQGDSWFFINNLAAIAMCRLNQRRYGKNIVDILQSSTDEILWENIAGMPGEIASASELYSTGCGTQAFSGGTYLALLKEFENYSGVQDRDSISFFWESTATSN